MHHLLHIFKKFSWSLLSHIKRAGKVIIFLSQNGNFGEYLKTKSDQNILNNTEILQITEIALFSKFSRTIIASAQL